MRAMAFDEPEVYEAMVQRMENEKAAKRQRRTETEETVEEISKMIHQIEGVWSQRQFFSHWFKVFPKPMAGPPRASNEELAMRVRYEEGNANLHNLHDRAMKRAFFDRWFGVRFTGV